MTLQEYRGLTKKYLSSEKASQDYLGELSSGSLGGEITEIKIENKAQLDKLNMLDRQRTQLFEEWRKATISL